MEKKYNLQVVNFKDKKIGIVIKDDKVLLDASHVCHILGYSKSTTAVLNKLDKDEKTFITKEEQKGCTSEVHPLGGFQDKWFVYEPGFYKLVLGSEKTEAKEFARWLCHEVIPELRKNGKYEMPSTAAKTDLDRAKSIGHTPTFDFVKDEVSAAMEVAKRMELEGDSARHFAATIIDKRYGTDLASALPETGTKELPAPQAILPTEKYHHEKEKILRVIGEMGNSRGMCCRSKLSKYANIRPITSLVYLLNELIRDGKISEVTVGKFKYYRKP